MADLDSDCVVVLGQDRLEEAAAARMVGEYEEYQARRRRASPRSAAPVAET